MMNFAFQVWLLDSPVSLMGRTSAETDSKLEQWVILESKEVGTDVVINTVRHPKQQIKL